jgi:excisionase family DNA binding protein
MILQKKQGKNMYYHKLLKIKSFFRIIWLIMTHGGKNMERQALLKTEEVARLLGVSPLTVRAWVFQRILPCVRLGRSVRFKMEDIAKIQKKGLKRNED